MKKPDIEQAQAYIDGNWYKIGFRNKLYCWHPVEGWILAKERKDETQNLERAILSQVESGYKYSL